ncbi:MAG: carbamoyltransferase HypF [Planctomycetes bacterium]|nr:carbamoyltransferase HypF [Planctomycetota bacterium]
MRLLRLEIEGIVQGVGFRPFVFRLASDLGLAGFVRNDSGAVTIEVEGADDALAAFRDRLSKELPREATIDRVREETLQAEGARGFVIAESDSRGKARILVPADLATCASCLREIFDPRDRRFRYPFTNCISCGPRLSIITMAPYDRARTTMDDFEMCADCKREYSDPRDRRYHAQPVACPACGPRLSLYDSKFEIVATDDDALRAAAEAIRAGKIISLKGLGGFQLLCDGTNEGAVRTLRDRKRRPDKPFALMMRDLGEARKYCEVSEVEARELTSSRGPIVLLSRIEDRDRSLLAPSQVEGNSDNRLLTTDYYSPYLGAMLPYTPLHHLLLAELDFPVICTSGNLSEEPMCVSLGDARERLSGIADFHLDHNRRIARPVDDSIVRFDGPARRIIRRARGFAPTPISKFAFNQKSFVPCSLPLAPCILALGGHLKNTVALLVGGEVHVSSHIGDLESAIGVKVLREAIRDILAFFEATPEIIACDAHPDYASTRIARKLATEFGAKLTLVQHHRAHAASVILEHSLDPPALCFAFDGSGYGDDGSIWGGEAFVYSGKSVERVASIREFGLPGGDSAAREPRRSLLGVLHESGIAGADDVPRTMFADEEYRAITSSMRSGLGVHRTSSAGRLFDAAAALLGFRGANTYEGHAACWLEYAGSRERGTGRDDCKNQKSDLPRFDFVPVFEELIARRSRGAEISECALFFHESLASYVLEVARRVNVPEVALTGGCFQNRLLLRLATNALSNDGFRVYTNEKLPANDGGISAGQIFIAANGIQQT